VLQEELDVAKFAFSCVVSIKDINKGEKLSKGNIWIKRPGTGKINANDYKKILKKTARMNIKKNVQLEWNMFE
jgi:sialic acid synthase SpsE